MNRVTVSVYCPRCREHIDVETPTEWAATVRESWVHDCPPYERNIC